MKTQAGAALSGREFTTITEVPNAGATADQLRILYTRYDLAAKVAAGKEVLEVACGAGVGLGLLARVARRVAGGDIDAHNCSIAEETYRGRADIRIEHLDAQNLPFPDESFDVVVLFEALYYIPSPDAFFREARRVLRPGGSLLISTVNCRWGGFNPSPFSVKYFDAAELAEELARRGFTLEVLGGFPESAGGPAHKVIGLIRKVAVALHLIPKTMKGKEWLKRMFYGKLTPIPSDLTPGICTPAQLEKLGPPYAASQFRFIYVIAVRPEA